MKRLSLLTLILVAVMVCGQTAQAKSYKFDIDQTVAETSIPKKHVDSGFKIIRAVTIAKNADKAIEQGMMCSVADALFRGIQGGRNEWNQESVPSMKPILKGGLETYYSNKDFFDKFFKKGDWQQFIRRARKDYPTGEDNVKNKQGVRIVDVYVLNERALKKYLEERGFSVTNNSLSHQ